MKNLVTAQELAGIEARVAMFDSLSDDELARLADETATLAGRAIAEQYRVAAARVAAAGYPPFRLCKSCALRPGTEANATMEGVGAFAEAVNTGQSFYCHETLDADGEPTKPCGGYMTLQLCACVEAEDTQTEPTL